MFAQISPMMTNEVEYRSELYKQEAEQARMVRQAKQGQKETRPNFFAFLTGTKKTHLSVQQG